jgi:hypothetical protein
MRKLVFFCILNLFLLPLKSQEINCIRGISTNPLDPHNPEFTTSINPGGMNSFLNTDFNWYPGNGSFVIDKTRNWARPFTGSSTHSFLWPFSSAMPDEFDYLHPLNIDVESYDFRWEDGWELLWLNLGELPNGTPTNNLPADWGGVSTSYNVVEQAPYFVLYNRYRGMIRIFANLWYGNEYQAYDDIKVKLKFPESAEKNQNYSGIFRHVDEYDVALDQPSAITQVSSPRFHAPRSDQWIVAEFQLGYDPCQCLTPSELTMFMVATDTISIDLTSRALSTEEEFTTDSYRDDNFLNLAGVPNTANNAGSVPGAAIYRRMDGMLEKYKNQQEKYKNELEEYNTFSNQLRKLLAETGKSAIKNGVGVLPGSNDLVDFAFDQAGKLSDNGKPNNDSGTSKEKWAATLESGLKSTLAEEANFMSAALNVTEKPSKPAPPVATWKEEVYKGYITDVDEIKIEGLKVPGTYPTGYTASQSIVPFTFPAYNEVLGLFAVLETPQLSHNTKSLPPSTEILNSEFIGGEINPVYNYTGRVLKRRRGTFQIPDGIEFAKNPALDWDKSKSQTLVALQAEVIINTASREYPLNDPEFVNNINVSLSEASNFDITHRFHDKPNEIRLVLTSDYYPIQDIRNTLYQYEVEVEFYYDDTYISHPAGAQDQLDLLLQTLNIIGGAKNLKIVTDNYFDQVNNRNEQINTFQVFTHQAYVSNKTTGDVAWTKYLPGTLSLEGEIGPNDPYVAEVSDETLYVRGENIVISKPISIANGYTNLEVIGNQSIKVNPSLSLPSNVRLRIDNIMGRELNPEMSYYEVKNNYCNSSYNANRGLGKYNQSNDDSASSRSTNEPVLIYPNPTSSRFTVKVLGAPSYLRAVLSNPSGQVLLERRLQGNLAKEFELDVNELPDGIYFLRIFKPDGSSQTKKVIKQ